MRRASLWARPDYYGITTIPRRGKLGNTLVRKGEMVGAVDFGSRDVRVLIARKGKDGGIQIIGHGAAPGRGCIAQGVIQDLGAAQLALKRALADAEKEAGVRVQSLFCGVNGKSIDTFIREGNVKLSGGMVELGHLDEALDVASRDILAPGKRVLSSITSQEWYVDDLRVQDPVGLRGSVLRARVHFAQVPSVIDDNLTVCIDSQNRELEDVVYLPLASGLGCLTAEDMDLGVAVLDMGRTITGFALYRERRIIATHTFEWGGFDITRDVAAGLQISFEEAIELIMLYGLSEKHIQQIEQEGGAKKAASIPSTEERNANIKLKTAVRGAPAIVERSELDMIAFERSMELMNKVRQLLQSRSLSKHLVRGVVLAGGTAAVRNMPMLCEAVFQVPARVGLPEGLDVLPQQVNAPEWVGAVGVIRHGFEYRAAQQSGRIEVQRGFFGRVIRSTGKFIGKYFF